MSGSSGLSGRYAKALYQLAKDNKTISKIVKDFDGLKDLLENNDNLKTLIYSPAVSKANKESSIIKILTKAKAEKLTINFCGTLAKNGRLILINEIIDVFLAEVSRINGEKPITSKNNKAQRALYHLLTIQKLINKKMTFIITDGILAAVSLSPKRRKDKATILV